jgi:hypothetical protein
MYHVRENFYDFAAAEDLSGASSRYKVVSVAGTIASAANKAQWAGILKFGNNSGQQFSAVYEGLTKAIGGAVITTPGWPVKVANSGFLVAAASGDQSCGRYLGTAASASGDLIPVAVDFMNPGVWGG